MGIPRANISVVEKNPMNITIYNIRNSAGMNKGEFESGGDFERRQWNQPRMN